MFDRKFSQEMAATHTHKHTHTGSMSQAEAMYAYAAHSDPVHHMYRELYMDNG